MLPRYRLSAAPLALIASLTESGGKRDIDLTVSQTGADCSLLT